ncbi:MAG: hypothetical protein OEU26_18995 [Candidatus Tectomicrobia bacterium]|nr:hypothetical protein [Candidatus Tectomicrobia bacterium]
MRALVLSAPYRTGWPQLLLSLFVLLLLSGPSLADGPDDSPPLTSAQQAAKQLAAALERDRRPTTAPPPRSPVVTLSDQSLPLGKRLVIVLYTSEHVEVRYVRGATTLASPVDDLSVESSDARRPVLTRGDDGAMAVEVLVDY